MGEADYGSTSAAALPAEVRDTLRAVARDRTEAAQYLDFLRNRSFRQTLLVPAGAAPEPEANAEGLLTLRVASPARRVDGSAEDRETVFRRSDAVLRTSDPLVKAAADALREAWPARIPFPELVSQATAAVTGRPAAADAGALTPAAERLAGTLVRCFETGVVDLHADAETFATELSERPFASPLARRQATGGTEVTSGHHTSARLEDVDRHVLVLCDGTRDTQQIAAELADRAESGRLALFGPGGRIAAGEEADDTLRVLVPAAVRRLSDLGLLVGERELAPPPAAADTAGISHPPEVGPAG